MDVVHDEHGRGWVWGSGRGVVTVRFETRETPAGPVRSFPADDEALHRWAALDTVAGMQPPIAAKVPTTTTHHGHVRTDDYEWLRKKDDPEVIAYLEAENAYTEERLAHLAGLREAIFEEMRARTVETDLSLPVRNRGYWYYGRSFEGRDYGASCRVPVADPDDWTPPQVAEVSPDQPALPGEQVLLDFDELARGHDFFSVGGSAISPSTTLLAYAVDVVGDERYTVRVKDLDTGELLDDTLTNVHGGAVWDLTSSALYYVTSDDSWRPDSVWRHALGTPQSDDELVYHEDDERFWVGVDRTRSDRFLLIEAGGKVTSEVRFLDLASPGGEWQLFAPRVEGVEYHLDHAVIAGEDVFLVHHDATGPDFEIATAPIAPTPSEQWRPLIAHDPAVRLEDVDAFAGHLVVHQRSNGLTQLRILELGADGVADDYLVGFDDEIYTIGSGGNPAWGQPTVRLGYTTMRTPASVYDYDVRTRELSLRKQKVVLGGYDPGDYEEHRLWATADDGARVPISLVVRKDVRAEGRPVPLHLYGYGSYEVSVDPGFSTMRLSELDRGAAYAIAHVRGGGEMGRAWYEQGRLLAKRNTFTDFIACARHLAETGWTTPELIVAEGASAGGLLMGAVANLAPEQFGGIVAGVPFVDALTTMLDASLPLTVTEYDEWGNPETDPEVYDYIAGYAPYDNVGAHRYPPIYADTSLNDTRVLYVEPAKWVARLRATAVDPDIVLKTEMAAGHGGVSGRYKAWHERAFTLAWVLDRLGLAEAPLKSR
jgi:oligopeptidase B